MLNKADQQALQTQQGQRLKMSSLAKQVNSIDSSLDDSQMADAVAQGEDVDVDMFEASDEDEGDMDDDVAQMQQPVHDNSQAEAAAALQAEGVASDTAQPLAVADSQPRQATAIQPIAAHLRSVAPPAQSQHDASPKTQSGEAVHAQTVAMSAGHSDISSKMAPSQLARAQHIASHHANSVSSAQAHLAAAALAETASVPQTQIHPDMIETAETDAEQAAQSHASSEAPAAAEQADTDVSDAPLADAEQATQPASSLEASAAVPQARSDAVMEEAVEADAEQQQQQPVPPELVEAIANRTRSRKRRAEAQLVTDQAAAAAAVPDDRPTAPHTKRQKRSQAAAAAVAGQRAAAPQQTRGSKTGATAATTGQRAAAPEKKRTRGATAATTAATTAVAGNGGARAAMTKRGKPATAPAWAKPVLESDHFSQAEKDKVVFAKMPGYCHWPAQVQSPTQEQKKALGITCLPPNQSLVVFTPQHQCAWVNTKHLLSFEAGFGQMQGSKSSAGVKASTDEAAAFVRSRLASPTTTPATLQ